MDRQGVNLPLPPKRFEKSFIAAYDSIRHKKWFSRFDERDALIVTMQAAAGVLDHNLGESIKSIVDEYGLCERTFRDYRKFCELENKEPGKYDSSFQKACNLAYNMYQEAGAKKSFTWYLTQAAKDYGIKPAHLVKLWENDPNFVPKM